MISSEIESTTNVSNPVKNEGKQFKMKVLMATSLDSRHGIENIVDGRINTFWISTGLFPQEIIIALSASVLLKTVTLTTMKVSHVILESSNTNIKEFHTINSQEIQDGTIQTTSFTIPPNTKAKYLKFIFKKGYSDFITVHKLNVTGDPILESTTTSSSTITTNKEKSSKSLKSRSEHKSNRDDNSKDKILVRQNIDSSSNIKINSNSNSNNNSTLDINASSNTTTTTSSTSKHKKKSLPTTEDNNLTDINTELQTSNSVGTRRESRRLTRMSTHNTTDSNNNGHHSHSKEKRNSSSTKLKENENDDN
ncbi:hypothetical protein BCR32DRAFT_297303 [Anaeromyces robustus]|uniref:F5/8 type C domain-containing protein n=1 Tax=Anaeromyces robustus TaxID=1754192 RepID=A0A1Y1WEU6_9FUNG|nr:hypothetical protein BCR32DRAFT_297303 [Anaeromyces robustus]|eukprot:ORX71684.1 hypothetical protein BCR32DRAFT_297303 [Anaeromyces robustus]